MTAFCSELTSLEGRYAKAFFEVLVTTKESDKEAFAHDLKNVENVLREAFDFWTILQGQKDLFAVLMTSIVSRDRQLRILERVLKIFVFSKKFRHFVLLIARHGRFAYFQKIMAVLKHLYMIKGNLFPVKVVAAKSLSAGELKAIRDLVVQRFHKNAEITLTVDPTLIAGYRIEAEGKIFDASLKKQLRLVQYHVQQSPGVVNLPSS